MADGRTDRGEGTAMISGIYWKRLGIILHRASYLKFAFYAMGIYYQFKSMVARRDLFAHSLCSMLLMYGLAMLLEGLRDNDLVAERRHRKSRKDLANMQWVISFSVALFSLVVLLGVFFLFRVGDKFQGEAILTFGIGGLALFRLEYDCMNLALAREEIREKEAPPDPSEDPHAPPERSGG